MNSLTKISSTTLLDVTKEDINNAVDLILCRIKDGEEDGIKQFISAKKGLEFFKTLDEQMRPIIDHNISYSEPYRGFGVEISHREQGVKYDYSVCGDTIHDEILEQIQELNIMLKDREMFLKSIRTATTIVDNETGDIHTIYPPIRSGKMGINCKF